MKHIFLLFLPFTLFSQTYTFSGARDNVVQIIASKILQKAYSRVDIPIKVIYLSPETSLQASNSGKVDGELARIEKISKLYPNLVQIPVPLVSVEAVAFSTNTKIKITKWDDLKNYNFTIIRGTKFIENSTKDYDKTYVKTFIEAFDTLISNKTDIIVLPRKAAIRLSLRAEYCEVKAISPILKKLKLYHFVHKKKSHLIPIIQPILKQMQDSGEIEYLYKSYLRSLTP
ncbi:MAG: hypothetical protein COA44_04765 [Arcobacter sp.]|nr:MAG: hypothetical protein COA44_04765 [Arcobacter sp.]